MSDPAAAAPPAPEASPASAVAAAPPPPVGAPPVAVAPLAGPATGPLRRTSIERRRPSGRLRAFAWLVAVVAIWMLVYGTLVAPADTGSRDLAELGVLLLIVLFVAIALLGRRLTTREVIRSIVAWSLTALLVITAYGYRGELAGVGGRILSAFAPGVPLAGRLVGESDPTSVVVMRARNGLFAVRARVDDVPLTLLVDPGASFVTLTLTDAAGAGIDPQALNFSVPIRTANGLIRAAPVTIDHLVVGSIERDHLSALVAPPDSLTESLLGMTFLETLGSYAISGDRMVLTN